MVDLQMTGFDGYDASTLAEQMGLPGCVVLSRVTSTLDVIHEMALEGDPHGTLVVADEQVLGRGSKGRAWMSPPGTGIYLSFLYRLDAPLKTGLPSLQVGLSVARALTELGIEAKLKWPNDVMVEGKKVAGVLCETRSEAGCHWIGLGVGVNVLGPLAPGLESQATTIERHRPGITRVTVLEALAGELTKLRITAELTDDELGEFERRDYLKGSRITGPTTGVACGIASDGALLVRTDEEIKTVYGGDVVIS